MKMNIKLFTFCIGVCLMTTQVRADDIGSQDFLDNYFGNTEAHETFITTLMDVIEEISLDDKAAIPTELPEGSPVNVVVGFYLNPSLIDCEADYKKMTYKCSIDGYKLKFGKIPDGMEYVTQEELQNMLTDVSTDDINLESFVEAVADALVDASTTGSDLYIKDVGIFTLVDVYSVKYKTYKESKDPSYQ